MELLFVDDLLIFSKADPDSLKTGRSVIHDMASTSGLHANNNKCAIYIAGVSDDVAQNMVDAIRVPKGSLPFRYLGIPLSAKRLISIQDCKPVVNKTLGRIQHWSSR